MQDEQELQRKTPESHVVVADRAMETFEREEEHPAHTNGVLTDASSFQGGVVERTFIPDEDYPDHKYTVWIKTRVLKPSDRNAIQGMINQLDIDNANISRLRYELNHLKPDSRIERREATLKELSLDDEEFKDNEQAYFDKKEQLQKEIDGWLKEYADACAKKQAAIEEILAKPNYSQTLRLALFSRVIADHTIGLPERPGGPLFKVDFTSPDPKHELGEEFAGALSDFIWDVLGKEGRAAKQSAKKKSRR